MLIRTLSYFHILLYYYIRARYIIIRSYKVKVRINLLRIKSFQTSVFGKYLTETIKRAKKETSGGAMGKPRVHGV